MTDTLSPAMIAALRHITSAYQQDRTRTVIHHDSMTDRHVCPPGIRITTIHALEDRGMIRARTLSTDPLFGTRRTFEVWPTPSGAVAVCC